MGVSTTVVFLTFFAAVLVALNLLETVRDEDEGPQNQPQHRWQQNKVSRFCSTVVKAIPLAAIRIVVVALQIIIQVRGLGGCLLPLRSILFQQAQTTSNDICVEIEGTVWYTGDMMCSTHHPACRCFR